MTAITQKRQTITTRASLWRLLPVNIVLLIFVIVAISACEWFPNNRIDTADSFLYKFFPLIGSGFAAMLTLFQHRPKKAVGLVFSGLQINRFYALLLAIALPGVFFARLFLSRKTTYFTPIVMMLTLLFTLIVLNALPKVLWERVKIRWLQIMFGLTAVSIVGIVVTHYLPNNRPNPEMALILILNLALSYYLLSKQNRLNWMLLCLVFLFITIKNTALIMLIAAVLCFNLLPCHRLRQFGLSTAVALSFIGVAVAGFLSTIYIVFLSRVFSDGHTEFRTAVLRYQWARFRESPLIGQLFTGESATFFADQNIYVPAHNDFSDMFVQGGIIAGVLFIAMFLHFIKSLYQVRNKRFFTAQRDAGIAASLIIFVLAFLITMILNPVIGKTDSSYLLWINMAFGYRLALGD